MHDAEQKARHDPEHAKKLQEFLRAKELADVATMTSLMAANRVPRR